MLQKLTKRNASSRPADRKGFTIIEVLIVLAIAGLILLIVFLAVPALQRNSRNTARRNDIGRVGGAVTDFSSNNNGTIPAASDKTAILTAAGTLSQYDAANISVVAGGAAGFGPVTDVKTMKIVTKARCNGGGVTTPGSTRQSAIIYGVETGGGGVTPICTDI